MDQELQKLYSVGPVLAADILYELTKRKIITKNQSLNSRRLDYEELRKILKNSPLYADLPIATKVDLKCNPIKEIPREFIEIIDKELHKYIKDIRFDIAGSYRRKKTISRDIDMVLIKGENNLDKIINIINTKSKHIKICKPFARGEGKATLLIEIIVPAHLQHFLSNYQKRQIVKYKDGNGKIGVRAKVDIFLSEEREYMFALLFATGSGNFNVRMRSVAKKKGYLLNQKGIYKKNGDKLKRLPITTEENIFKLLNMSYKTPENRIA